MARAVAEEQGDGDAGPLGEGEGAGGLSEGCADLSLIALGAGGESLVEAGSADYADH